jgi:hypothetical protein
MTDVASREHSGRADAGIVAPLFLLCSEPQNAAPVAQWHLCDSVIGLVTVRSRCNGWCDDRSQA